MSILRPYGDTTGDGMVQVSFTLPLPHDKRAEGAALQLATKKVKSGPIALACTRRAGSMPIFFASWSAAPSAFLGFSP